MVVRHFRPSKVPSDAIEKEELKVKLEILEEMLRQMSRELQDNIGPLLITAKMHLHTLGQLPSPEYNNKINHAGQIISDSLRELRSLSKGFNPETLAGIGVVKWIEIIFARYNKFKLIDAQLSLKGDMIVLDRTEELLLLGICVEFFRNAILHSRASMLTMSIESRQDVLYVTMMDNGVGFDTRKIRSGVGLKAMARRAHLIHATYQLVSSPGNGVTLSLTRRIL